MLHGILTNGYILQESQRPEVVWNVFSIPGMFDPEIDNPVFFCGNAIRRIFCIGRKKWRFLVQNATLPNVTNKSLLMSGNKNAVKIEHRHEVVRFLNNIADEEEEPVATRYIQSITGLLTRDEQEDNTKILPPHYSKRMLYERFCYEYGYIAKTRSAKGNYSSTALFPLRPHDDENGDMALWPSSCTPALSVPSWKSFNNIWDSECSNIKIRAPSVDMCMACTVFHNRSKYLEK